MSPPTLSPSASAAGPRRLHLEPLTPASFAPFGTAIAPPLDPAVANVPKTAPPALHAPHQPAPVFANQDSALKTSPISQFTDAYPSHSSRPASRPQMSMFSCFPRNISGIGVATSDHGTPTFAVSILERHPYTTQTFSPLGLAKSDRSTVFLVIVAPSLSGVATATSSTGATVHVRNPPDLSHLKVFVARGDQAVTYGPGTWHAPMVVLGRRRVDFVVTQFVNGVADDDCQEVLLGDRHVDIDLSGLDLGLHGDKSKL